MKDGKFIHTPLTVPVMCVGGGGILSYPSYCASNVCLVGGGDTSVSLPLCHFQQTNKRT